MAISAKILETIPLFLGLSQSQIEDIASKAHFNQRHFKKGAMIIEEGQQCDGLMIITEGWFEVDTASDNHAYHLTELIQAPMMIEPDKLFGLSLHYRANFRAYTTCETICIPKDKLMQLFTDYIIVRINLMNAICRRTQQLERRPWQNTIDDLQKRITNFIKQRSNHPVGKKTLYIKMIQLATELNASRLDVSIALNAMADAEKIILKRGIVEVPALQLL